MNRKTLEPQLEAQELYTARDFLFAIRRYSLFVIGAAIVGLLIYLIPWVKTPPLFVSRAQIDVLGVPVASLKTGLQLGGPSDLPQFIHVFAMSVDARDRTLLAAGQPSLNNFESMHAESHGNKIFLTLTTTSAARSEALAKAWTQCILAMAQDQKEEFLRPRLAEVAGLETELTSLIARRATNWRRMTSANLESIDWKALLDEELVYGIKIARLQSLTWLKQIDHIARSEKPPETSQTPLTRTIKWTDIAASVLFSVFLSITVLFLKELFDDRIRGCKGLRHLKQSLAPVLIPRKTNQLDTRCNEALSELLFSLNMIRKDEADCGYLTVTAVADNSGREFVAEGLAQIASKSKAALLVEFSSDVKDVPVGGIDTLIQNYSSTVKKLPGMQKLKIDPYTLTPENWQLFLKDASKAADCIVVCMPVIRPNSLLKWLLLQANQVVVVVKSRKLRVSDLGYLNEMVRTSDKQVQYVVTDVDKFDLR